MAQLPTIEETCIAFRASGSQGEHVESEPAGEGVGLSKFTGCIVSYESLNLSLCMRTAKK